jgi:limonene-1,2-epoxide hydrolase
MILPLRAVFVCLLATTLVGCAGLSAAPSAHSGQPPASGQIVIEKYLAALNRRDLLALTAYVTPDVEWYSMVNGERILEVSGRDALTQSLQQHFAGHANTTWSIEAAQTIGNHVAVTERSQWSEDGRVQSRSTLGVYEFVSGRIRRITYFLSDG